MAKTEMNVADARRVSEEAEQLHGHSRCAWR